MCGFYIYIYIYVCGASFNNIASEPSRPTTTAADRRRPPPTAADHWAHGTPGIGQGAGDRIKSGAENGHHGEGDGRTGTTTMIYDILYIIYRRAQDIRGVRRAQEASVFRCFGGLRRPVVFPSCNTEETAIMIMIMTMANFN